MEKVIFLITFAFLSCSLVLNAQNSGKLSYNSLNTLEKQQLENAEIKLKDATIASGEKAELQKLITELRKKAVGIQTKVSLRAKHSGGIGDASKKRVLLKNQLNKFSNNRIVGSPDQAATTPLKIK